MSPRPRTTPSPDPENAGHPGSRLGLPAAGRASLAGWWNRLASLLLDWFISLALAAAIFGLDVLTADGWRAFVPLGLFFVHTTVMSTLTGGSIGQLFARVGVIRLDGRQLGPLRAAARQLMLCLVLPAVIIDGDRRGLNDLLLNTVVVNRR